MSNQQNKKQIARKTLHTAIATLSAIPSLVGSGAVVGLAGVGAAMVSGQSLAVETDICTTAGAIVNTLTYEGEYICESEPRHR